MKKAFTLVELVFIIAIIGLIATVALPKLTASRNDALAVSAMKKVTETIDELIKEATLDKHLNDQISNPNYGFLPNQNATITKLELIEFSNGYKIATRADDNSLTPCAYIPKIVNLEKYAQSESLYLIINVASSPVCEKLSTLINKKLSTCRNLIPNELICKIY